MRTRVLQSVVLAAIFAGMVGPSFPALAAPKPPNYVPYDAGPEIRSWEPTRDRVKGEAGGESATTATATALSSCTLDTKYFLYLDDANGFYDFALFDLVAESGNSQIWVQQDLSWPGGDPRTTPVITCEQAAYLQNQFDTNMYPKEINFFGTPDLHDGSASLLEAWEYVPPGYYDDSAGRQVVLVENVRDANYYDSTYPLYIAGFFSPSLESYFDRNTMTIDAYDWANRTGPSAARPFLYEGVFAHEYQHLLHSDYDPDEEDFINEGMSDFAEFLVGYHPSLTGHIQAAASNPENSLVAWGDQGDLEILTDYGQAYLFQLYMYEQFGKKFTQALFRDPANGISGVNATLKARHIHSSFADVVHDWLVAMLIDSSKTKGGRYAFANEAFNLNVGTPSAPNPEAFNQPGAPPWGGDFLWITGKPKDFARLTFNGVDYSTFPTAWTSDGDVLWGGSGDLIDNWAIFETPGGGTLTFDTKYDMEEFWDFGFVQVSTDGGYTWTSLSNDHTTDLHDPSAHPTIVANLPGLTGDSEGYPDDWVSLAYDLGPYAGQNILVAFRYVTDWATSWDGWFIDNVKVDGNLISDGSDASVFKDITQILPINNDFSVTFVARRGSGNKAEYKIKTMRLDHTSEQGMVELQSILKWCDSAVMIVTYDAAEGVNFYADYSYEVVQRGGKPHAGHPVHGGGEGTRFHHRHH